MVDIQQLKDLTCKIKQCEKCGLCKTRQSVVVGRGSNHPKYIFIGEAPGKQEDIQGRPFVGDAGRLLDKWIAYMGMPYDEITFINILKCIPLEGGSIRKPTKEEMDICKPWLEDQLKLLSDKDTKIILVGATALEAVVSRKDITVCSGGLVAPNTYAIRHPAFFLRNPNSNWEHELSNLKNNLGLIGAPPEARHKRILVFDIETTGLNPLTDKIKFFGAFSYPEHKYYILKGREQATEIQRLLRTHNVYVGYNSSKFDIPFMEKKGYRFSGEGLDLKKVVETRLPNMEIKLEDFKMDTVAHAFGLPGKNSIALSVLQKEENTEEEIKDIVAYLTQDVAITKAIYEKMDDMFKSFLPLLGLDENTHNFEHLTESSGSLAYKVVCREAGLEEKYGGTNEEDKYKGADVLYPDKEEAKGTIWCFDFSSAYPHAYMQANLYSKTSKTHPNCPNPYKGGHLFSLKGTYCGCRMGSIEQAIQRMYFKRQEYKKTKDTRQFALKIILNTIYGISGNGKFLSVYDLDTASDCTYLVREWLNYMKRGFEKEGYEVLYGDTDSNYILDPFNNKEKIVGTANKLISEIKSSMVFPQETFKMELEKEIKYMAFFPKKDEDELKGKHYLFVTKDDKLVVKGLKVIASNCTGISKDVFKEIEPQIIKNISCKFDKDYIEKLVEQKVKADPTRLAFSFKSKPLKDYDDLKSLPAQVSERYGPGNHKMVRMKNIGIGKSTKLLPVEEAKNYKISDFSLDNVYSELSPFIKVKNASLSQWF